MPILDSNCVAPQINKEQIAKDIDKFLKKKEWKEYEIDAILPVAVPFYFCLVAKVENVLIKEDQIEVTNNSKIENVYVEVNATNGQVSEELYKKTLDQPIVYTRSLPDVYKVENKIISPEKAASLAMYYVKIKNKDANVSVAGLDLIYWPIWKIWVKLKSGKDSKKYLILYDCVFGKILNEQDIPEREVGWIEVFYSLTGKVSNPNTWFEYGDHARKAFFKTKDKEKKFEILVIILLIILIILLIFS